MRSKVCYRAAFFTLLFVTVWRWPVSAGVLSETCQSLAAVYARAPEQLDAKELVALQKCLAVEAKEKSEATEQQPREEWGEWPASTPWTPATESWPSSKPW